jgi:hypothetical protein
MKNFILSVTASFVSLLALGATPSSTSMEVSFAGQFRGTGPFPATNTTWFVLSPVADRFELVETRVEVRRVPDICSDFATRVTASQVMPQEGNNPLLMVRGSSSLRSGPVDTVFFGDRYLYPGEHVSFSLNAGTRFGFLAYGSAMPDSAVTNYSIRMLSSSIEQVIAEFPVIDTDGPPKLLWAGDLDRDDKPDVLFDLTTSYAGRLYVLFLSSKAADGQLIGEVGRFRVTGC